MLYAMRVFLFFMKSFFSRKYHHHAHNKKPKDDDSSTRATSGRGIISVTHNGTIPVATDSLLDFICFIFSEFYDEISWRCQLFSLYFPEERVYENFKKRKNYPFRRMLFSNSKSVSIYHCMKELNVIFSIRRYPKRTDEVANTSP